MKMITYLLVLFCLTNSLFSQSYYPYSNAFHLNIGTHLSISDATYEGFNSVENNPNLYFLVGLGYVYNINEVFNIEAEIDVSLLSLVQTTGGGIDDHEFHPKLGYDLNMYIIMTESFQLLAGLRSASGTMKLDDDKGIISNKKLNTSFSTLQFGFRYMIGYQNFYTIKISLPEMEEVYKGVLINSKEIHIKMSATFFLN